MRTIRRRIAVIGNGGSGKTWLGRQLAQAHGIPHVQLDALAHGENWSWVLRRVFADRVEEHAREDGWVIEGINRHELLHIVLPRADTLVWLDMPRRVAARRLFLRTLRSAALRTEVHGNRESWRDVWHPEGFVRQTIAKHDRRQRNFGALVTDAARPDLRVLRLRTPRQVRRWLRSEIAGTRPSETAPDESSRARGQSEQQ